MIIPFYCQPGAEIEARNLAQTHGLSFLGELGEAELTSLHDPLFLWLSHEGLSVRQTGIMASGPVRADFAGGAARHRRYYGGGKSQTIAKAVGIRRGILPSVADLTAGLGGDAFALASLGCAVTLVERHPIIAALLEDGLRRAGRFGLEDEGLRQVIERMSLVRGSAAQWLEGLIPERCPDVIYLDPMFPERRKSAKVNKNMQLFQQLVGGDEDADSLLPLALEKARFRVVVKRPSHAPWLDGREPPLAFKGKSVRFDVYPLRKMVMDGSQNLSQAR